MARSKIILNIHAWDEINSLETVRISFLLANRNFVISENSDHNPYGDGLIYAPYSEIVEKCIYFLGQPRLSREAIGFKGFMNIHHIDFAKNIQNILLQMGVEVISKAINSNKFNEYGYSRSSREDILQFIPKNAKSILDIGCASGLVGLKLKQRQQCEILGIEINPNAAIEAAEHLDGVLCGAVEHLMPALPNQKFDCILLLDVIEHLSSPDLLLNLVHEKLTSYGCVIVSVPNVAHWTIIQGLLEGSWSYSDSGILDKTQKKFFTFTSIVKLLLDAGFNIQSHSATKLIAPEPSEKIISTIVNFSDNGKNIVNQSMAYQFIFVCKKQ
jgi:2-polyprenyl-3-methyl-5-hydroxy-6-metoxy-1,4-benzoquinol methylase